MRVRIRDLRRGIQGLHPNEAIAVINTLTGPEELVVFTTGDLDSIEVGYPVAVNDGNFLVELPSETSKGAWRVWVSRGDTDDRLEAAE